MDTKALTILKAIQADMQSILPANGYQTDAGTRVYLGKRSQDQSAPHPFISIFEGEETVSRELGRDAREVVLTVLIEGYTKPDQDAPLDSIHELVGDIKQAIGAGMPTLDNLATRVVYRGREVTTPEPGGLWGGVSFTLEISYYEGVSDPYSID